MATESVKIIHIEDTPSNADDGQVVVSPAADSDLGFVMWGGKDMSGDVTLWLAKNKPAYVSTLRVTGLSEGLVTADSSGDLSAGTVTLSELNALVSDATLDDSSDARTPTSHASTHENGGADEINVAGLSGLLADNQNPTAHAAEHTDGTDDIQDATAAQKGLMTSAYATKLDGIETAADVTDATNVNAAGAVMEADFNANTILAANTDNTPSALTVAEDTLIGRETGGNIDDLSMATVRGMLGVTEDVLLYGATTSSGSEDTDILSLTRGGTDYPSIVNNSYKAWKVSLTAYGLVTGSTEVRAKWSGELQFAEDATGGGEVNGYMEPDFSFYMLSDITLSTLVFDCDSNEIKITVGHTDTSGSSTIYWDLIAVQQEAAGWFGT